MKTILLFSILAALCSLNFTPITVPTAAPPVPILCKMSNGQNRPFPCEFQIVTMFILGKNNEIVGKITPTSTSVKLPRSKAVKMIPSSGGESYFYNVSLDFKRINTPSFSPKPSPLPGPKPLAGFYQIGTSTVTSPISPGEVKVVKTVNVAPNLPEPGIRPKRVAFTLQLNYTTGSGATIVAPVQYVEIRNPITFTKFPNNINLYRDRAEAHIVFSTSVDMTK
ncbi:hypothetical protein [Spirosoma arcticum]